MTGNGTVPDRADRHFIISERSNGHWHGSPGDILEQVAVEVPLPLSKEGL